MREDAILRAVGPFYSEIERLGYTVQATTDFEEIKRLVPLTGRERQTPMMAVTRNDFTAKRAFWLFLYKDGEVIGGVAAKYDCLGDESFTSFMRRTSREQYGTEGEAIIEIARPAEDLIRGNLIYIGELELHPEHRGKLALLEAVIKVLQALCAVKWPGFDWMYAFIPEEHLRIAYLYGFYVTIPEAIIWTPPSPPGRLDSHAMVTVEGRHIEHLMKTAQQRFLRKRAKSG